jgi:HAD superfamily hydrolase (TIGR01509 family)
MPAAMRAVIFDFDGVLVNSEPLHYQALRDALRPESIEIDEEEYLVTYLAYDDRQAIRVALERHGVAFDAGRLDTVARRKAALFDAFMREVPLFPGAAHLVRSLAAEVPLAIASGALRHEIEAILSGAGLREHFTAVIGADDVHRTKPHPEPYLAALGRLRERLPDLRPEECLAIEDSMPGILSARAAGMTVMGVAHSYPSEKLTRAHRVVASLRGLDAPALRALFTS